MEILNEERGRLIRFMAGLAVFVSLFAAAAYFISVVMTNYSSQLEGKERPIPVSAHTALPLLIIDPGHGGEDGGSSSGEVLEKDINLSVSKNIRYLCALTGIPAKATREDDRALYDMYGDLDDYGGKKKIYDLKNRVRFVKEEEGGAYLAIHQNMFPDPRYGGLQVWYSGNNEDSAAFAEEIRRASCSYLDPENRRETKRATSSIYVLYRAEAPSVLVECGFLSNPEDLARLTDQDYRKLLSSAVFSAAARFLTGLAY